MFKFASKALVAILFLFFFFAFTIPCDAGCRGDRGLRMHAFGHGGHRLPRLLHRRAAASAGACNSAGSSCTGGACQAR